VTAKVQQPRKKTHYRHQRHAFSSRLQGNNDSHWPCLKVLSKNHYFGQQQTSTMSSDIEAGASPANETTPLVDDSPASIDPLNSSVSSGSVTSTDDIKEELEKPWPATFERGIQILASPMLDVKKVADYTKSPSVRARYKKVRKIYTRCNFPFLILWLQ
jgi:hypothetical protein